MVGELRFLLCRGKDLHVEKTPKNLNSDWDVLNCTV